MAGVALVAAALLLFAFAYLISGWRRTRQRRNDIIIANNCKPAPRYPHKDPLGIDYFIASFKAFKEHRLLRKYEEDFEKYGTIFQVNQFGHPVLVSKEPGVLESCMVTDFDSWGVAPVRFDAVAPFLGQRSFFIIDGHWWKFGRAQSRPALSKHEYGDLNRLEKHVHRFLALLPRDRSTLNLKEPFHRLTSSFATEYFFGQESNLLAEGEIPEADKRVLDAFELCMLRITTRCMKGSLVKYLPLERDYADAIRVVHDFVDKAVDQTIEAQNTGEKKYLNGVETKGRVFLDDLVAQISDRTAIRDAAITMYTGSTDTTAGTLTGICFALARAPGVVEKLRAEILRVSPDPPDLATLQKMEYLKCVVYEGMRLYGIDTCINFRGALKDTVLPIGGGSDGSSPLFVKKGTTLAMDYRSMKIDQRWWGPDAREFRPERFQEASNRPFWAFQAFGGGPRSCPGQNLAFTNVCYTITRLLQEFKGIESRDDRPWTENLKMAVENLHGAEVGLIPA